MGPVVDATSFAAHVAGTAGPSVSSTLLGDFARFLKHERGVPSANTIRTYLQQAAILCEQQVGVKPVFPDILHKALDRQAAAEADPLGPRRAKEPASIELVQAFVLDEAIPLVLRTAATLLWHGTFRASELLSKHTRQRGLRDLCRGDVAFAADKSFVRLTMHKGKALRKNEESVRLVVAPEAHELAWAINPVAVLERFLRLTSHFDAEGPLLRHNDGSLATTSQLRDAIKRKAAELGLDPALYGNHSFRSGGNTRMHALGVPDADVQQQGGWLSEGGDAPYRRRNLAQSRRAQSALRVPGPGHALPTTMQVSLVSASSPLLDVTTLLRRAGPP
jgi:integrase